MASKKLTVWMTKYALTTGVKEVEIEPIEEGSDYVYTREGYLETQLVLGKTAFLDRKGAMINARQQCTKRIASLQRQIAALEKMKFE